MAIRRPRFTSGARASMVVVAVTSLALATFTSALGASAAERGPLTRDLSLSSHATRHCGPVTFIFSPTNPVTYFQVNATGVSCAVAKNVLVKGGKYHGVPPAGWTYVDAGVMGTSNCFVMWKRGPDRVVAYRQNVNGEGC